MEDNTLVQSSFSAMIHAPMEKVDIPAWCFSLSESEYHLLAGSRISRGNHGTGGRRMSINVEVLGGAPWYSITLRRLPNHITCGSFQTQTSLRRPAG